MRHARIRMHGALGDFLPVHRRDVEFEVEFELPLGLRDLVQSTGVPHVEVETAVVDGEPADWSRVIGGGRIAIHARYPLDDPPVEPAFLLDAHLGKLAAYLRLVGVDADHDPTADDPDLVRRSAAERRILLTRDRALLMHGSLRSGSYVRATDPLVQAAEIVNRFVLGGLLLPFSRCMACNGVLGRASAAEVAHRVPASVLDRHDEFHRCGGCERVYWAGSHHERLLRLVAKITAAGTASPG